MNDIIAIFDISNNYPSYKYVIKKITNKEVIIPPLDKEEIIKYGELYSPPNMNIVFKYLLGYSIYSLRNGANILIQLMPTEKYNLYFELQEQIISALGYKYTSVNLTTNNRISFKKIYEFAKTMNKKLTIIKYIYYVIQGLLIYIFINKLEKQHYENLYNNIEYTKKLKRKINIYYSSDKLSIYKIIKRYIYYKKTYNDNKNESNKNPIKILLINNSEETFNKYIINQIKNILEKNNTIIYQVEKPNYLYKKRNSNRIHITNQIRKYLKYNIDINSIKILSKTIRYCQKGLNAIIILKLEKDAISTIMKQIINKIANDYKIKIIIIDNFDKLSKLENNTSKVCSI